jgi:hypothetical protein
MSTARYTTLLLGIILVGGSLMFETKDGGNIDFYQRPLSFAWIGATILLTTRKQTGLRDRLSRAWWLQILAPVIIFGISYLLVLIYEPYPVR